MNTYEDCRSALANFIEDYRGAQTRNEATTRLQLIDRLFFDCLGWTRDDFVAEAHHEGEYADYIGSAPRPLLVVEAKREGNYFELPAGKNSIEYSLPALSRDNPNTEAAIKQVARYCQERGIPLAAVCNGHQMVTFVAIRTDQPPLEGRALVFPSLEVMLNNFTELWDAVSKPAIENKLLESRLLNKAAPLLPTKLSATIYDYPGTKGRNSFQTDLKIVSELVLEDLVNVREFETQFLKDCYCESGALSDFSLVSRNILQARYEALFDEGQPGPTLEPAVTKKGIANDILARGLSRRPILILGDVGVGKTTFIRHLMKVDAADIFEKAVALHLNLGTQAALTSDLKRYVLEEIQNQLLSEHQFDIEESGLVRGVYNGDLQKFGRSIYASLKETAPDEYAKKELELLEAKVKDKAEHIKRTLHHVAKGWKKQIVIFLDNADQRDYKTQQEVFLISQELADSWPATVFVTLRPETFHISLKSGGTLSGYHPKAFTVAPPRIDKVIQKRLMFALRIAQGDIPLESHSSLSVHFSSLELIIEALLSTLANRREIGELVDNMAGGNVRLALDLIQSFLGSGHVDTKKIVDIQKQKGGYIIPLHEFLRGVIYGDTVHYDPTRSYFANIFDVSAFDPREHFVLPLALSVLATWTGEGVQNGFVESERFYNKLQGFGYTPDQIDNAVIRAHRHKLIELTGRRTPEPGRNMPPSIRVTSVGIYHADKLSASFSYLDAVIVDVPLFEKDTREKIRDTQNLDERLFRVEQFCSYLDKQWKSLNSETAPYRWPAISQAVRSDIELIRTRTSLA